MNYYHFLAFFVYCFSVLISGALIYSFVNKKNEGYLNWYVYAAELFLLGSILVVGELLFLAMIGLYKANIIWGMVLFNYAFVLNKTARKALVEVFTVKKIVNIPFIILIAFLGYFIFRNCFFLVTGDSHNIYLYAQRLWLERGTCLFGNEGYNIGVFTPHFNAVPYSLGIALFGQNTLFAQLISLSWRVIAILLIFGYMSYRLNGYYGLVAALLVLLDEHILYSGISSCVIINGALIAFMIGCVFNFWESRKADSRYRFLLALIFLICLMANKYQMAYSFIVILILGFVVQKGLKDKLLSFISDKRMLIVLLSAAALTSLWYLKNYLVTGCPTFPIFADKLGVLNWTPALSESFAKVFGSPGINIYFKYMNYFYVWPGVLSSKLVVMIMSLLPIVILTSIVFNRSDAESMQELCFWLSACFLVMLANCLIVFCDPRVCRYLITILSYSTVLGVFYIAENCFCIKRKHLLGFVGILVCAALVLVIIKDSNETPCKKPDVADNINVLLNRLSMKDIIDDYYPKTEIENEAAKKEEFMFSQAAWDSGRGCRIPRSAFLSPERPQVGLWCTTVIKWDSYDDVELIKKDLEDFGISWVMRVENDEMKFMDIGEYAIEAVKEDRFPKRTFYNYGFPKEILEIKY